MKEIEEIEKENIKLKLKEKEKIINNTIKYINNELKPFLYRNDYNSLMKILKGE